MSRVTRGHLDLLVSNGDESCDGLVGVFTELREQVEDIRVVGWQVRCDCVVMIVMIIMRRLYLDLGMMREMLLHSERIRNPAIFAHKAALIKVVAGVILVVIVLHASC